MLTHFFAQRAFPVFGSSYLPPSGELPALHKIDPTIELSQTVFEIGRIGSYFLPDSLKIGTGVSLAAIGFFASKGENSQANKSLKEFYQRAALRGVLIMATPVKYLFIADCCFTVFRGGKKLYKAAT